MGMRKVRFLYDAADDTAQLNKGFDEFLNTQDLTAYISTKQDGGKMEIWAKQNDNTINELILRFHGEENGTVIVALVGKADLNKVQSVIRKSRENTF